MNACVSAQCHFLLGNWDSVFPTALIVPIPLYACAFWTADLDMLSPCVTFSVHNGTRLGCPALPCSAVHRTSINLSIMYGIIQ